MNYRQRELWILPILRLATSPILRAPENQKARRQRAWYHTSPPRPRSYLDGGSHGRPRPALGDEEALAS